MIYLPCMTLMQTCLMCWSVGALPWGRKKKAVICRTIDRVLLQGKWTDVAGNRWLDLQQDNCPHCPGGGVCASQGALTPCAVGWSLHRETAGTACDSLEGPRCQAGQWRPVLPARLGVPAVLLVLPLREAPDRLQAPSSRVPRGCPPRTKRHSVKPGLNTSLLNIDIILIFKLWGLLHSIQRWEFLTIDT